MKTLLALLLSLSLATPALADYSGSAVLDWSSLTFSGVDVDLIPRYQQQGAYLFTGALTAPTLSGIENQLSYEFPTGTVKGTSEIVPFPNMGWSTQTASITMPTIGTVNAIFDATQVLASTTLFGIGFASSATDVNGFLVAHQTGNLTVSIGYTIAHEFAPQGTGSAPDFFAQSHLQLIVTDATGQFQADIRDVNAPAGSSVQSGVLSVTQFLTAGVQNYFTASTSLDVNHPVNASEVRSVPLPGMLWPTTAMGLAGLGWLWVREWRRVG